MKPIAPFEVLFLCTGNSARSIFGEYIMRKVGKGAFNTQSAGANPRGEVHPMALRVLREAYRLDPAAARSKSVNEFLDRRFDYVITLCDRARETCPAWPDGTVVAHWSSPDPFEFVGTDEATYNYFTAVAAQIQRRIELMCCLPLASLDEARRERLTREIGEQAKLTGQE
jgi:arsenate reductase